MKDRVQPCIHYVCAGADCKKGFKCVTLAKCKNCAKYQGRKCNHREEPFKLKKIKSKEKYRD